jgi:small subunit ribosomal protein S15
MWRRPSPNRAFDFSASPLSTRPMGRTEDTIRRFSPHGGAGATEAQIALLTERIEGLLPHFRSHSKDHASRRGLLKLVGKRTKLLRYLQRVSPTSYERLVVALGIRTSGRRPTPEERRRALEPYLAAESWRNEVRNRPVTPSLDEDMIDALSLDDDTEIEFVAGLRTTATDFKNLAFAECKILSSVGTSYLLRGPVRIAKRLAHDPKVRALVLRSCGLQDPEVEEFEHDELGETVPAQSSQGTTEDPGLAEVHRQFATQLREYRCKVLIIDDGFDLAQSMYQSRLEGVISVGDDCHVLRPPWAPHGRLGRGDHGDRVAELVLRTVPNAELFIAHRDLGNKLEVALHEVMSHVRHWVRGGPLVVNLSFGSNLGAHNGRSRLEDQIQDAILHEFSPVYVVKSAGNEGPYGIHAAYGSPRAKDKGFAIELKVSGQAMGEETASVWHDAATPVRYVLEAPSGERTEELCGAWSIDDWGSRQYAIAHTTVRMHWSRLNHECELRVRITGTPIAEGIWRIWLYPALPTSVPIVIKDLRAWLARTKGRYAAFVQCTREGTITIPGTSHAVISATGHDGTGSPLAFASQGPAYGASDAGCDKPEVALPAWSCPNGGLLKQGTSFAAARLSGIIGMMVTISKKHDMPVEKVRQVLRASSRKGQGWSRHPGYGVFDWKLFIDQLDELS